jgi:hypothetical protein
MFIFKITCRTCGIWREFSGVTLDEVARDIRRHGWDSYLGLKGQYDSIGGITGHCGKCLDKTAKVPDGEIKS